MIQRDIDSVRVFCSKPGPLDVGKRTAPQVRNRRFPASLSAYTRMARRAAYRQGAGQGLMSRVMAISGNRSGEGDDGALQRAGHNAEAGLPPRDVPRARVVSQTQVLHGAQVRQSGIDSLGQLALERHAARPRGASTHEVTLCNPCDGRGPLRCKDDQST